MSHLRNLIHALVERRLWPVALLLAVALAAVPVLVGRAGDDATQSTAAVPATPADAGANAEKAEMTIESSPPAVRTRPGKERNPFAAPASARTTTTEAAGTQTEQPNVTPNASSDTGSAPSAPASHTGSASTGGDSGSSNASPSSSGATSRPDTTTSTPKAKAKPKPKKTASPTADDASDTYHVSLRFGLNGGELKTLDDVARLSPLPSVTDPFFVYLGVLETTGKKPEKRAVFLVSSDATPNGEGACHPTKQDCESVELAVGQTAYFDYTAPSGAVTQYQLELKGIHQTAVKSAAKASAAIARHSVAGAELLQDAAKRDVRAAGARAYRYVPATGLLTRAKRRHVTAKA